MLKKLKHGEIVKPAFKDIIDRFSESVLKKHSENVLVVVEGRDPVSRISQEYRKKVCTN